MSKYAHRKWVITIILLFTIAGGITLVTVPWSHATSAKAEGPLTGNQFQNCNLQLPQTEWGYTFYPCAPIGLGSYCLTIHYSPHLTSRVAVCPYTDWAVLGYFDVICQTTGDNVFNTNIWDELVPQNGEPAAYVSDYYMDTSNPSGWSPPIPQCT